MTTSFTIKNENTTFTSASTIPAQELPVLTPDIITRCIVCLEEKERARNTISQYRRTLNALYTWLSGRPVTQQLLVEWKASLSSKLAPASVNAALAAVNALLKFMSESGGPDKDDARGWKNLTGLKYMKVQRKVYCDEKKEIGREEYEILINTAKEKGDEQMVMLLETLCALGVRVSELRFITVEAVNRGEAMITCKGKTRAILIPHSLAVSLLRFTEKKGIKSGPIFITRTGKCLSRGFIWLKMKKLAAEAGVAKEKSFPHNLRHLFARSFYEKYKNIKRLADILGHSSMETTRLYLLESGRVHMKQLEGLGLVL